MKCGSQMAVAVLGGYLLGRSHKTQLAVLLAVLSAVGGKLPIDERELLRHTPLGAPLDKLTGDLRSQLVDAGMSVAKKAASSGIDSVSDKLQQRAETMRGPGATKGGEPAGAEEPGKPARRERSAKPEREEASDDYDDYEGEEAESQRDEPAPESDYREESPPTRRPARSEPRRRVPRRDEEQRPRTGRAPR